MLEWLIDIDTSIFLFLNSINHPVADTVMKIISGKMTWVPLYALVLFLLIYKFKWRAFPFILAPVLLVALTDLSSVHLFKNVFLRLRPCHEPALRDIVHLVDERCGGRYGFVSSHAANTFGFATLFAFVFSKRFNDFNWLANALIVWAAVVSYSRIYLGVHYPADIICGALLGFLLGYLVWKILEIKAVKNLTRAL